MWQNVIQNESVAAGSNHVGFYKSRKEFWLHPESDECEVKGRGPRSDNPSYKFTLLKAWRTCWKGRRVSEECVELNYNNPGEK